MYKAGSVWITPEMFMTDEEIEQKAKIRVDLSLPIDDSDPKDLLFNHTRLKLIQYIAGLTDITSADVIIVITGLAKMLVNSLDEPDKAINVIREALEEALKTLDIWLDTGFSNIEKYKRRNEMLDN